MSAKEKLHELVARAAGVAEFDITVPPRAELGHYSTNAAMRIGKQSGKNPMAVAEEVAKKIASAAPNGFFQKVEAAPPGFVNFWLTKRTIQEELKALAKGILLPQTGKGKTVIVEYSQPNIAKKMHVGHLRTTVLGDALANIHEALGYKVVRWNYLGDWGTQFGKLIAGYKLWGDEATVKKNPIETLLTLYVRFHDEMKRDPALENKGREEFRKLEEGDAENKKLWEWFKAESLKEFHKIYGTLGVKFDLEIGESFFDKDTQAVVDDLVKKGIAIESQGSLIIPLENVGLPPALVRKSDGATLYLSRDIANLEYRLRTYKPAKILYVVGNEQSLHFTQLFAVAKILGLDAAELVHVKYGLVLAEEGKKFATREGRAIFLEEVIQKAVKLARGVVEEKSRRRDEVAGRDPDSPAEASGNKHLSEKEKDAVAHAVALGALKYANLKENRNSDISFKWSQMINFSGDSAPYLQYTYARMTSILAKSKISAKGGSPPEADGPRAHASGGKNQKSKFGDPAHLETNEELAIVRKMIEFPDVVAACAREYQPNLLCVYLYELANAANAYYESTPILSDENADRRNARLLLVKIVAGVLKQGLELLGIRARGRI